MKSYRVETVLPPLKRGTKKQYLVLTSDHRLVSTHTERWKADLECMKLNWAVEDALKTKPIQPSVSAAAIKSR